MKTFSDPSAVQTKHYWRSLHRLFDSPAVQDRLADEFRDGAARPPDGITRRRMLELMSASFALAGLASCRRPEEKIVPYASPPEQAIPGIPKYYATTMPLGTSAYGMRVESHEGRPTKIEGNPLHPSSRGAASVWMQATILGLYDPDRSQTVRYKPSPKSNTHQSSWDAFLKFWTELSPALESSRGKDMAILTEAYSSPTFARLAAKFLERFPEAAWVAYDPVSDENIYEGLQLAAGQSCRPLFHLERARTILSLDADFLLTESDALYNARNFAEARRISDPRDEMNRLYVVESALSVTGAAADHRLRLQSRDLPAFAAALALELQALGVPVLIPDKPSRPRFPAPIENRISIIAADLAASGSTSVIVAGRRQPPEVHALVLALNQALGAFGNTLSLYEPEDANGGRTSDLRSLATDLRRGQISTLILLGGNPAYAAPFDLHFPELLHSVPHTLHLSTHLDETSRLVEWHLPQSHFLESWSDARAADGTAGVIQPLISPLFESRSAIEVLGILARDQEQKGYDLVRETWMESLLGPQDFESRWRRVLHDGILEGSALPSIAPTLQQDALAEIVFPALLGPAKSRGQDLEVVFQLSPAVYDGRFANNGWLQELPDPITKITWDTAVLLSPATAKKLNLESGEVARLIYRGSHVEAPVWISPGQADDSITLTLGYGRTAAGRVGSGVGVNFYLLRHSDAPYFDGGLRIERTGRRYLLAQTQDHWEMEGRSLIREGTLEEYRSNPDFAAEPQKASESRPLWQAPPYDGNYQWGMAIDLNSCIGCNACIVACQSENNIPIVGKDQVARGREMHWLRVDRYFAGPAEHPQVRFQPVPCMNCENAPCEQVCPVAATVHDGEGLNTMVYNRCIGTRYCSNNCPYKVRRFNFFNHTKDLPELVQLSMNPDVTVRSRGVMEKCTYCIQRIHEARIEAKRAGRSPGDGDVKTACQQTCPAEAIVFGNINDPNSRVSQLKKQARDYLLLAHLNTKPRTSYLAKIQNPTPAWKAEDTA